MTSISKSKKKPVVFFDDCQQDEPEECPPPDTFPFYFVIAVLYKSVARNKWEPYLLEQRSEYESCLDLRDYILEQMQTNEEISEVCIMISRIDALNAVTSILSHQIREFERTKPVFINGPKKDLTFLQKKSKHYV